MVVGQSLYHQSLDCTSKLTWKKMGADISSGHVNLDFCINCTGGLFKGRNTV